MGTREALIPGVMLPGREADHSPPSGADEENMWSYNSLPIRFHGLTN
jgi:hypothetical protein